MGLRLISVARGGLAAVAAVAVAAVGAAAALALETLARAEYLLRETN